MSKNAYSEELTDILEQYDQINPSKVNKIADKEQIRARDEINHDIYTFPPEGWKLSDVVAGLSISIIECMQVIDLTLHSRLEPGSRSDG